jgi:hypothetical protein
LHDADAAAFQRETAAFSRAKSPGFILNFVAAGGDQERAAKGGRSFLGHI